MKLSPEQIADVKRFVQQSGIINELLQDDIIDHLCCAIEIKISKGEEFNPSLQEAIEELAPEGLKSIQSETVFLLNSKKIIFMKKLTYSLGLLSVMSFVIGWGFGMLHFARRT